MAYRRASFRLYLRLTNSEKDGLARVVKYDCGTTALAKRIYRSCLDHHALFRLHRLNQGEKSVSWVPRDSFPFTTETHLRRLHPTDDSTFLSLAPSIIASPLSSIATHTTESLSDKPLLSEPDIRTSNTEPPSPLDRRSSRIFHSAHYFFHRLFRKRSHLPIAKVSQPPCSRCPHSLNSDQVLQQTVEDSERNSLSTVTVSSASPFYTLSEWNRPSLPGPLWRMSPVDVIPGLLFELPGGLTVSPDLRLFACQGQTAKTPSTEWRGCRATWGISENPRFSRTTSCPRRLFYEVRLNGNEPVRVGWATKNASLVLGEDALGFAYQTSSALSLLNKSTSGGSWFKAESNEEREQGNQSPVGALIIGGASVSVIGSSRCDVIGCYLDLDARLAHWTRNGVTAADMTISIGRFPSKTVFFPACAIRISSVTFNFGDTPFAYGPMLLTTENSHSNWLPLASASLIAEIPGYSYASPVRPNQLPIRLTQNPRSCWHLIPSLSPGLILSPDRLCARALHHFGWQTLHASKTVTFGNGVLTLKALASQQQMPNVYFEVHLLESLTTTPGAGIFLGFSLSDPTSTAVITPAYPISSDCVDTFGLVFEQTALNSQTCLAYRGIKQPYGRALHRGDVIGCTLNLQHGLIFWSINGGHFGHTVHVCGSSSNSSSIADDVICIPLGQNQTFNLLFCLTNTTIEVNFGDGATSLKQLSKQINCIPLSHYRRLLDDWDPLKQCAPSPSSQTNPISKKNDASLGHRRQHSLDQGCIPANRNGSNDNHYSHGFHKSISCPSSTVTVAKSGVVMPTNILDSIIIMRSRIPLVPTKTRLWRCNSTESVPRKPVTSPTFAAPWSQTDRILPIVRTHRIAASTLLSDAVLLETDIDKCTDFKTVTSAVTIDASLYRSSSDSMIGHWGISVTNKSSFSSLVKQRMALIPVVPTRIVRTRACTVELPMLPLLNAQKKEPNGMIESIKAGEETLDRRRHVTDLTLPASTLEVDLYISSPLLAEFA